MEAKEEALKLFNSIFKSLPINDLNKKEKILHKQNSINSAIICVDNFIEYLTKWIESLSSEPEMIDMREYYKKVKKELKKI